MSRPPASQSGPQDRGEAERQARVAREAAALRENLRRRKQQARARLDGEARATLPEPAPATTAPTDDEAV